MPAKRCLFDLELLYRGILRVKRTYDRGGDCAREPASRRPVSARLAEITDGKGRCWTRTGLSTEDSGCSEASCSASRDMPVTRERHAVYTPRIKSEVGLATCSGLREYPQPVNDSTISETDMDGNQNVLDIVAYGC